MSHRALCAMAAVFGMLVFAMLPTSAAAQSNACDSHKPAVIGGPVPAKDDDTMVLRWLGNANYEISYHGQVYLFDTYFNRKARNRPIGFTAEQVTRADMIFVGHAHFDHISDVGPVARQTKAPVFGAPITIETALKLGVPADQTKVAKGGETFKFSDVVVDGLEPLFSKIRAEMPETAFIAPLYRSPICVATSGSERGKVVAFRY